ncbi:MAG: FHA domain-containing protein [Planctomycetota bacterium]
MSTSWRSDLAALSDPDPAARLEAAARLRVAPDDAFDALRALVTERAFCERELAEAEAILRALKQINPIRAIGVFYELASRTGLVSAKTRQVAGVASQLLDEGHADDDAAPAEGFEEDEETSLEITSPPLKRPRIGQGPFPGLGSAPDDMLEAKTSRIRASDMWREEAQVPVQPLVEPPVPWTSFDYTDEDAQRAIAWLRCAPFDPVPVGVREVFNIGRSKQGDLVLSHPSVSRVHAVIRVSGKKLLLEDRSTYGTWVNGERIMSHALVVGDTITIGPYDVLVERDSKGDEDDSDTRPLRTFASSEAIGGRIERVSLAEVLQQMEFNQKTGTLSVFSDDGVTGTLVVYDGAPMYAEFGQDRDNQAVIGMLRLKKGSFSFLNKIEPGEMTMQGTLTGILLEASRQQDEGA